MLQVVFFNLFSFLWLPSLSPFPGVPFEYQLLCIHLFSNTETSLLVRRIGVHFFLLKDWCSTCGGSCCAMYITFTDLKDICLMIAFASAHVNFFRLAHQNLSWIHERCLYTHALYSPMDFQGAKQGIRRKVFFVV